MRDCCGSLSTSGLCHDHDDSGVVLALAAEGLVTMQSAFPGDGHKKETILQLDVDSGVDNT